ncbi:hypothetical protein C7H10_11765 [Marinobacter shengliensis]|nr:hypothetical protein C7H10_11765 [Marinobacter shengliensis]
MVDSISGILATTRAPQNASLLLFITKLTKHSSMFAPFSTHEKILQIQPNTSKDSHRNQDKDMPVAGWWFIFLPEKDV